MREHGTLHIPDVRSAEGFPDVGHRCGRSHTSCPFPFVSKGISLERLNARRIEVRPFTPAQIKLLETFADQAVIAIENVRLFPRTQGIAWSSKRRRVKSWALSLARRRIFSQCWIPSPRTPHGFVTQRMLSIFRIDGNSLNRAAHYGPIPWAGGERVADRAADGLLVALLSTDRRSTYTIWRQSLKPSFLKV